VSAERAQQIFAVALVTGAAVALFFTGKLLPRGPPVLNGSFAFAAFGVLPLCFAVALDARRHAARIAAGLLGLGLLVPLSVCALVRPTRAVFRGAPELILCPALVGLVLLLWIAARSGVSLVRWGLGLGDWRWWLPRAGLLALGAAVLSLTTLALDPEMRAYYPDYKPARKSLPILLSTLGMTGLYLIGWEWLFRGYLLTGVARVAGPLVAVLFQALPFFIAHRGGPASELVGSFVGGILLGAFCWRAKSFWAAPMLHWVLYATTQLGGFYL